MRLIIPNFWRDDNIISLLLTPLSWMYRYISSKVSYVPEDQIYCPRAKIITVGNVTVGGAGKTPVVISLAQILKNYSKVKFAILTRGYKGKLKGPTIVTYEHSVDDIGDEALLLSKSFITCVAKNRLDGIKFLENLGYEIIITDDGLQDQRFKKKLSLMVIDSNFAFGNQKIFPAGPLRESIESGLKKSDIVVKIGNEKIFYQFPMKTTMFNASLESKVILANKKFIAFAGIGNPEKFFNSVKQAEGEVIETFAFADHHSYTKSEIETLLNLKQKLEAELITTEKDYTRIPSEYKAQIQALPVSIVWQDEKILLEKLLRL